MKTVLGVIGGFIGIFVILIVVAFATGEAGVWYDAIIGKQEMNVQRHNYESSQSYVEGKLQELSKDYAEYSQTTDPTAKTALLTTVRNSFAEFDSNNVTDPALQNFLLKARGE